MAFFLKDYQRRVVDQLGLFLEKVSAAREEFFGAPEKYWEKLPDYTEEVWQEIFPRATAGTLLAYSSKQTGHGQWCPNFCLKVPTAGGKTLLATYAIEHFLQHLGNRKTGLVLWVVPSEMIFQQTVSALQDRAHGYRQKLDDITGGRVRVITKKDRFSPQDIEDSLVVLVLMLQSFSRQKNIKENLKVFQDDGRFPEFFPLETDMEQQEKLLQAFPNLDIYEESGRLHGLLIKTSLGNVIKILEPLVILDEGHKAKSELAVSAIPCRNFAMF